MKLIVLFFFIFGVCSGIYLFITFFMLHLKDLKKINWMAFIVSALAGVCLVTLIASMIYTARVRSDSWCTTVHITNNYPPADLVTAMDYFEKGNYDYDKGDCNNAILSYSESIAMNPNYPQAFNNRAYTYMRMEEYDLALADLDKALEIDPNYTHALRNRADVNNYRLGNKSEALVDYKKIIEINGNSTDVCAHIADANNNSKNPLSFFRTLRDTIKCIRE